MSNCWTGPAAAIFVLLFAFTDSAFQLDPLKSNKLAQLFLSRNLSLQFDVQQRNGSENVLFEIIHHREQQQQKQPIFRFSTSTIQNNLLLEFQLEDGRRKLFRIGCPFLRLHEQFHKIIFLLNDNKIVVIVNCQQLFSAEDNELNFGNFALRKLNAKLVDTDNNRGLHLRQFSADSSIQLESQCPNLQTLIGNRIATEYLPAFEMNHVPMPVVEPTKQQNPAAAPEEGELFQQRVELLEHQLAHWNKLFARFESRIKRVELHQRGCTNEDGSQMAPGQRVQNLSECMECQCGLDGDLHCRPIGCPRLDCEHPVQVEGKCCPECGQRCLFSGNYYNSGETYWPKPCIFCRCDNGKMACQYKDPKEHCPVLDCPERETLPNQCCPVCVNVDHCAAAGRNPCSEHANCRSGRHSAICRCKEGFFGNGTKCYDVDECLWDVDARKQLGGCGDGTVCVNLPGTFKCECLPGYQKLDSRNCLDVIRI